MEIRTFRPEDAEAICKLHKGTLGAVNSRDYTPAQIEAWIGNHGTDDFRSAFLASELALVACNDQRIVGFGNIDYDLELRALYVHKDHLGEGIGSTLLHALEEGARLKGIDTLTLHSSVTARTFYPRHGWREMEEVMKYMAGAALLSYRMMKQLIPDASRKHLLSAGA